jgi:phage tail-like protein
VVSIQQSGSATLLASGDPFTALTFDRLGRLHVGTAEGVIYQFAAENAGDPLEQLGVSFAGVSGRIDAIADWPPPKQGEAVQLLLAIVREGDRRTTFWSASTDGACGTSGSYVSKILNSGIEQCPWHRLVLRGNIPQGSAISVFTQTASVQPDGTIPAFIDFSAEPQFRAVGPLVDADCLVQSVPGQLMRFRLDFQSSGLHSPELTAIDADFPRNSYLRFLPSIYQDDPESRRFLDRFLSLFQTLVDQENETVDTIYRLFDPLTIPEPLLPWLASWLAFPLDPSWELAYKRRVLAGAFAYYQQRGTKAGLELAVRDFARVGFAAVVEHFQLRNIPDLCCGVSLEDGLPLWSPQIYSRWQVGSHSTVGELHLLDAPEPVAEPFALDAHRFSLFFPADPHNPEAAAKRVSRIVSAEKPAHTEAILCAVCPRFRVGVQSRVGVDSMIGDVTFMMLSGAGHKRTSLLGYDTILNPSMAQAQLQQRGLDVPPAVGGTTRLL